MPFERLEATLPPSQWRELADLAEREGISEIEMLSLLIDRAYEADLWAQTQGVKPNSPPGRG